MSDKVFVGTSKYDENVNTSVAQQKEYQDTFLEFAAKNRQQITASMDIDTATDPTEKIYTVPNGFSFFVTNIQLSAVSEIDLNGFMYVSRTQSFTTFTDLYQNSILTVYVPASPTVGGSSNSVNITHSYSMPLKFRSGESIYLNGENADTCFGWVIVTGFLEPSPSA